MDYNPILKHVLEATRQHFIDKITLFVQTRHSKIHIGDELRHIITV